MRDHGDKLHALLFLKLLLCDIVEREGHQALVCRRHAHLRGVDLVVTLLLIFAHLELVGEHGAVALAHLACKLVEAIAQGATVGIAVLKRLVCHRVAQHHGALVVHH